MDGIHDLGGLEGFDDIGHTRHEPPFHAPWEGRVHGMLLALSIAGNMPSALRPAIERLDPVDYLTTTYYEHWLHAIEGLVLGAGLVDQAELDAWHARIAAGDPQPRHDDPAAGELVHSLFRPFPVHDPDASPPRFAPGDQVQVRRESPRGHTRCPRYVRGATGTIERVHAPGSLPDEGAGDPAPVEREYTVAFSSEQLWGSGAEPCTVMVDLWESYLEEPS